MTPFDIEQAKRGAAVCTRDGRQAQIIAVLNSCFIWRVHAFVKMENGKFERIRFTKDGREFGNGESKNDLFMADEKPTANP